VWRRLCLKDVVQGRNRREERGTGRCQGVKSLRVLLSGTIQRRWRDLETVDTERGKYLLSCDWRAIRRDGSAHDVRGLEKIRIALKSGGKKQRITLPTPMKLGRAMCTDSAQAARDWSKLANVRVHTSTEQIRVESVERGLRVERGTEGKLEGRAMLGMVAGLVCLRF